MRNSLIYGIVIASLLGTLVLKRWISPVLGHITYYYHKYLWLPPLLPAHHIFPGLRAKIALFALLMFVNLICLVFDSVAPAVLFGRLSLINLLFLYLSPHLEFAAKILRLNPRTFVTLHGIVALVVVITSVTHIFLHVRSNHLWGLFRQPINIVVGESPRYNVHSKRGLLTCGRYCHVWLY